MSDKEHPWWYESESGQDRSDPSPVGTAAQEAIKLAAALSQWADRTGLADALSGIAMQTAMGVQAAARAASSATDDDHQDNHEDTAAAPPEPEALPGHDSTSCDFCPVCQGVSLLRAVSPEAATGVAEALAAVTEAFRSALDTLSQPPSSATGVEHIDID